jgi:hypothetical protein
VRRKEKPEREKKGGEGGGRGRMKEEEWRMFGGKWTFGWRNGMDHEQ